MQRVTASSSCGSKTLTASSILLETRVIVCKDSEAQKLGDDCVQLSLKSSLIPHVTHVSASLPVFQIVRIQLCTKKLPLFLTTVGLRDLPWKEIKSLHDTSIFWQSHTPRVSSWTSRNHIEEDTSVSLNWF